MATLINGNGNHAVYASQDADWFGALTGNQTVIMNVNQNLAYELLDNNTLLIKSGVLVTKEGRRVQIDVGDTEEIIIPTGTQNVNRFYICGFKLETDGEGVQTATTFIEQMGSSTETITEETFKDGANTIYVSLYRIYQQGIAISAITPLKDTVSIPTTKAFDIKDLIDIIHPIGKILMTDDSRNPAEYYPGTTWVAWGSGRVPVGVNSSDSDFNAVGKTGGAKSVTLTAAQSGMPAHGHGFTQPTVNGGGIAGGITGGSHSHQFYGGIASQLGYWQLTRTTTDTGYVRPVRPDFAQNSFLHASTHSHDLPSHTHSVSGGAVHNNGGANASAAHTNLQPYITCYMWKRTA
jgi:hypothetical protein